MDNSREDFLNFTKRFLDLELLPLQTENASELQSAPPPIDYDTLMPIFVQNFATLLRIK